RPIFTRVFVGVSLVTGEISKRACNATLAPKLCETTFNVSVEILLAIFRSVFPAFSACACASSKSSNKGLFFLLLAEKQQPYSASQYTDTIFVCVELNLWKVAANVSKSSGELESPFCAANGFLNPWMRNVIVLVGAIFSRLTTVSTMESFKIAALISL